MRRATVRGGVTAWIIGAGMILAAALHGCDSGTNAGREGGVVRMYFAPSQNPTTMLHTAARLERFVTNDTGITLQAVIPTSYSDLIEALTSGRADVAWSPPFAYIVAHSRAGAKARLQVERTFEQSAILVTRTGEGEPVSLADLAGTGVAVPQDLDTELQQRIRRHLSSHVPGWRAEVAGDDRQAVEMLLDEPDKVSAAVSSWISSGPYDLIGDGRKQLQALRPEILGQTRILERIEPPVQRRMTSYLGCFISRTDSEVQQLADIAGRTIAYTDEASTSGFIFPRALLRRLGITPSAEYFVGSHTQVVQEVWANRVAAGVIYYSPPGAHHRASGSIMGDARGRALQRLETDTDRLLFLEKIRIIALTDPIPSSPCCVRQGFPEERWQRIEASFLRFLATEEGRDTFSDLIGAVSVVRSSDATFNGLRQVLEDAGVSAEAVLRAHEEKIGRRRR